MFWLHPCFKNQARNKSPEIDVKIIKFKVLRELNQIIISFAV